MSRRASTEFCDDRAGRLIARLGMLLLIGGSVLGMAGLGVVGPAMGQGTDSILSLLPRVDEERLAAATEIWSDPPPRDAVEAAAKLLWAIARVDPAVLDRLAPPDPFSENTPPADSPQISESPQAAESTQVADLLSDRLQVVRVRGKVERYDAVRIPPELTELLEFKRLYRVVVEVDSAVAPSGLPGSVSVVTRQLPTAWLSDAGEATAGAGQPVEFTAVGVGDGESIKLFASRLRWYPGTAGAAGVHGPLPDGWRMLAAAGVDIVPLADVAARNRQSLTAEDSEVFYGMLAAAAALGKSGEIPGEQRPEPMRIQTMQMLREPAALAGHWIRVDLETARLSRVAVTSPELREELGRDAYWQIDAFGNLSGAKVQLESPGEAGEPLTFENRFPVSLAILDLPDWLSQRVHAESAHELAREELGPGGAAGAEGTVAVRMLSEPVTVDGFFFRLWSYDSEFAESRGGRQISPLIVAVELHQRPANVSMQRGVAAIGWILAAVVLASMAIATFVLWRVGRRDRQAASKRRAAVEGMPSPPRGTW